MNKAELLLNAIDAYIVAKLKHLQILNGFGVSDLDKAKTVFLDIMKTIEDLETKPTPANTPVVAPQVTK